MKKNLNKEIGARLRLIRFLFNEGGKLSAEQFGYLIGYSTDKILNYELGRASVPIELLIELYHRGFNPIFLLTGKESIFARNNAGKKRKKDLEKRGIDPNKLASQDVLFTSSIEKNKAKFPVLRAAAGMINSTESTENHHQPED